MSRALISRYSFLPSDRFHKCHRPAASATPRRTAAGLWQHRLWFVGSGFVENPQLADPQFPWCEWIGAAQFSILRLHQRLMHQLVFDRLQDDGPLPSRQRMQLAFDRLGKFDAIGYSAGSPSSIPPREVFYHMELPGGIGPVGLRYRRLLILSITAAFRNGLFPLSFWQPLQAGRGRDGPYGRPPRRSERAGFPHSAPALGRDAQAL